MYVNEGGCTCPEQHFIFKKWFLFFLSSNARQEEEEETQNKSRVMELLECVF